MISLCTPKPGEKMADLGSGDGRVVIEFAKLGIEAHGFEIDPKLVSLSQNNIFSENLTHLAHIHITDFWEADLSSFDLIIIYGMPDVLPRLENKLQMELKTGTKVISSVYEFPSWSYSAKKDNVYLYALPELTEF